MTTNQTISKQIEQLGRSLVKWATVGIVAICVVLTMNFAGDDAVVIIGVMAFAAFAYIVVELAGRIRSRLTHRRALVDWAKSEQRVEADTAWWAGRLSSPVLAERIVAESVLTEHLGATIEERI